METTSCLIYVHIGTSSEDEKYKNREHPAFDYMVDHLLEKGFGYAFYIFQVDTPVGHREKIVFYSYIDDNCPAKTKMIMTSSRDDLAYKVGLDFLLKSERRMC